MKSRLTLLRKIVLLAVVNYAVLLLVFLAFLLIQVRGDMESTFFAPVRARAADIAREIVPELQEAETAGFDAILARYSARDDLDLYLFLNDGPEQVGGASIDLPAEVARQVRGVPGGAPGRENPPPPPRPEAGAAPAPPPLPTPESFLVSTEGEVRYWIGVRMPVLSVDEPGVRRGTLVAAIGSIWSRPLRAELWLWPGIITAAAVASVLMWLPLVRGLTRSVGQMTRVTGEIANGRFDAQAGVTRTDELGTLSASIHRMAKRVDALVKEQKRFLADAAHELRSPLGRMQVASEILQRHPELETVPYLSDLKEDIEVMSNLTEQLLLSAKAGLRPESVQLVPVRVAEVVGRAVAVEAGQADVRIDAGSELIALADAELLFRAVSNLIRNSVRYAASGGPIQVSARPAGGEVWITVADSGPGVPDGAIERIFEPFFRIDRSRGRKTGGTGLGLAIVRTVIEACEGSIECRNRAPTGLEITMRFQRAGADRGPDRRS